MDKDLENAINSNGVYEPEALKAVFSVETSGKGFDPSTGKLIIRFEANKFRVYSPKAKVGTWATGLQRTQSQAWDLFNSAAKQDLHAAMMSTSIGVGQIMGFNYLQVGCKSVDAMWDEAKANIVNQVQQVVKFISSSPHLNKALKDHDWATFALYYNGPLYKKNKYDTKLATYYKMFKK